MTEERWEDHTEWPSWLCDTWARPCLWGSPPPWIAPDSRGRMCIGTREGVYKVLWGDWIIKDANGELSVCKSDIFEATYEPARAEFSREFDNCIPGQENYSKLKVSFKSGWPGLRFWISSPERGKHSVILNADQLRTLIADIQRCLESEPKEAHYE